jgi:hypothetical protein
MIMKTLKSKVAALALTTAAGIGVFATTVHAAAAGPNDGGTNCHGVWMSYLSTSGMAPGQLHKDFGASVKDVQATADIVCGS